jgi:regulatory protein RepA
MSSKIYTIDDVDQILDNHFGKDLHVVSSFKTMLQLLNIKGCELSELPAKIMRAEQDIEFRWTTAIEMGELPPTFREDCWEPWIIRELERMQAKEDRLNGQLPSPYDTHNFLTNLMGAATAEPIPALFTLDDNKGNEQMFMPRGKVSVLASEGGLGKSLLAMHLGISLALNKPTNLKSWCNQSLKPNPVSGKVVLLYAEEDLNTCLYRLRMQLQNDMGEVNPDLLRKLSGRLIPVPLCVIQEGMDSSLALSDSKRSGDNRAIHRLERLIRSLNKVAGDDGIDLIVIDPLSQFGGADFEVDNGEASRLMHNLQQLTLSVKGKPTLLAIHHSSKTSKKGKLANSVRGSSALKDNARWASVLRRVDEDESGENFLRDRNKRGIIELVVAKSNYGPNGLRVRCISHSAQLLEAEEYLLKANRRIKSAKQSWEDYQREMLKVVPQDDEADESSTTRGKTITSQNDLM